MKTKPLELLKLIESHLILIKQYFEKNSFSQKLKELEVIINQENFWQNPDRIKISKSHQNIKDICDQKELVFNEYQNLQELSKDGKEEDLELFEEDLAHLYTNVKNLKTSLLLNEKYDQNPCFIEINPGAGGTESQDWAAMLLRMYTRFAEQNKLSVSTIDISKADEAGIKTATIRVKGKNAYGLLKGESGVHRLVRISPFDSSGRRHTSFASALVTPEIEEIEIKIEEKDLKIETYKAGGAGGQHVNTTDSAVRITHIPTGITAQCQNERSQLQNKQSAMKILSSRVQKHEEDKKQQEVDKKEKRKIEWGSQIRSYVLYPYKMVKDHRTGEEVSQAEAVLDGNLMPFIEKFLVEQPDKATE